MYHPLPIMPSSSYSKSTRSDVLKVWKIFCSIVQVFASVISFETNYLHSTSYFGILILNITNLDCFLLQTGLILCLSNFAHFCKQKSDTVAIIICYVALLLVWTMFCYILLSNLIDSLQSLEEFVYVCTLPFTNSLFGCRLCSTIVFIFVKLCLVL